MLQALLGTPDALVGAGVGLMSGLWALHAWRLHRHRPPVDSSRVLSDSELFRLLGRHGRHDDEMGE